MINKINVRVYATLIKEGKVLALYEEYAGENLIKFPGGGLEFGEGVIECLKRELAEELNITVSDLHHLYTQEDFIASKFRENEQLLTIYYTANIVDENELLILDPCIEKIRWVPFDAEENPFVLPVDRVVFDLLRNKFL